MSGRADLAVAFDYPFVGGHFPQSHGSACVELLGADADFGSKSELCAVGERCGRVDIYAGRVDKQGEQTCVVGILGDYGFAVS